MLPPVTIPLAIPGSLWRRWKEVEPRVGIDLKSLLPALLEVYLDREEHNRDGLTDIEYQI
jgi:hypothetical protein